MYFISLLYSVPGYWCVAVIHVFGWENYILSVAVYRSNIGELEWKVVFVSPNLMIIKYVVDILLWLGLVIINYEVIVLCTVCTFIFTMF